jgi:xanthine dehydrogenase accessory factor
VFDEFFSKAYELLTQGRPFATATVVRAEKPTSAKPGDKAIVTLEGVMHGWIGGSCAQPTVIELAMKALADGEPRFVRLSTDPEAHSSRDGLMDLPMTCFSGGTLEIYIEPHLPPPRLMIIGNLPVAQALIRLGRAMNYHTIAIDPDNEGAGLEQADEIITNLEQIPARITALTYIVVATHGHYDELALEYALRSKAAYVALVASKTRSAAVLEYLAAQGLSQEELARLKYPAGLDIQALRGDEIALSIVAEIVQRRRNADPIDVHALLADTAAGPEPTETIDPVCGMTVQIANAEHRTEYRGQMYYFCCQGCRETFEADPEKFVTVAAPSGEAIDHICGMTVDIASAKYMSEYEGQFYYFCAAGCKATFDKSPEDYIEKETVSNSASG